MYGKNHKMESTSITHYKLLWNQLTITFTKLNVYGLKNVTAIILKLQKVLTYLTSYMPGTWQKAEHIFDRQCYN